MEALKLRLARNETNDNSQKHRKRTLDKFYISNRFNHHQVQHIDTGDYIDHLAVLLRNWKGQTIKE